MAAAMGVHEESFPVQGDARGVVGHLPLQQHAAERHRSRGDGPDLGEREIQQAVAEPAEIRGDHPVEAALPTGEDAAVPLGRLTCVVDEPARYHEHPRGWGVQFDP